MKLIRKLFVTAAALLTGLTALPRLTASAAETVPGDVNGDGSCGIEDVYLLRDYLLGKDAAVTAQADLDGSGSLNAADLTLLKRMLLPPKQETAVMMVYLCGADLESELYEATNDLNEMRMAEYGDTLTVVVQTGGTPQWHTEGMTDAGNDRIVFDKNGMQITNQTGAHAMSDPAFLQSFITETAAAYPADHYGLVLWGHGMGSVYGMCYDPLFRGTLSLGGIHSALTGADIHFDWIGFDSCLMATAETAYALRGCADYMVASTESISGYGWFYSDFLTAWAAQPDMDTAMLTEQIMEDMISVNSGNDLPATISCCDLQYAEAMMQTVCDYTAAVYADYRKDGIAPILTARAEAVDFGQEVYDMADLASLAGCLQNEKSSAVQAMLRKMIVNNLQYEMESSSGIAIWFFEKHPEDGKTTMPDAFRAIGLSEDYIAQLSEMADAAYTALKSQT